MEIMRFTFNVQNFLIVVGIISLLDWIRGYFRVDDKKKYIIKSFAIGTPIILILFLFGPLILLSPIKIGYASLGDDNLTVYYLASKPADGRQLLEISKKAVETNEKFYRIPVKTKVLLAPTRFDSFRFTGNPIAGGTGCDLGVIVRKDKANEGIITHELSHKTLIEMTNRSSHFFPRWFDEGLASYLGKMDYYKDIPELKDSLKNGTYYRNLKRWNGFWGKINWTFIDIRKNDRQIYGQTYLIVRYLFDTYGEEKVYQLLMACKGQLFDQAFEQTFDLSVDDFHQQFIEFVES